MWVDGEFFYYRFCLMINKLNARLTQPINCAQNLKAEFQDPEKALEHSRRKNMVWENYLKTELSKLNCIGNPVKEHKKSRSLTPYPDKILGKLKKTLQISPSTQKPARSVNYSPIRPYPTQSSVIDSFLEPFITKEKITLPPLIKSVPIHQDPSLSFPKKNSADFQEKLSNIKNSRIQNIAFVHEKCENFLPQCREDIQKIKKIQAFKCQEHERVEEFLGDFSDCLKISSDQKNFEESFNNKCYNRRLDEEFKSELDDLKVELMEVSKNAIEKGGKKIWRWKNTLFLAKTNRIINSVPKTRK